MTKSAGEVDLPTCGRAKCVLMYVASKCRKTPGDGSQIPREALPFGSRGGAEIGSRQEPSTSSRGCCTRLIYPRKSCSQIQIAVQSALYDGLQHCIVEPSPPTVERRRGCIRCSGRIDRVVKSR